MKLLYMSKLYQFFSNLLRLGVTPGLPFSEVQKAYLFNYFSVGCCFVSILYLGMNIVQGKYIIIPLNVLQISILPLNFYFTKINKQAVGRPLLLVMLALNYTIGSFYSETYNEPYLLTILIIAAILLDTKVQFIAFSIFFLTIYCLIKIDQQKALLLSPEVYFRISLNLVLGCFSFAFSLYIFKTFYTKHQEKLESALHQISVSKREMDKILQVIAHDLRSPIKGIAILSSASSYEEASTDEIKESLRLIQQTSIKSLDFVNNLLELESKSKDRLTYTYFNLTETITEAVKIASLEADGKMQTIYLSTTENQIYYYGDANRLYRLVMNLLGNAIKFSKKGGDIEVELLMTSENEIMISVKDFGVGISMEEKRKIFALEDISMQKGTAGEKSFGMGLLICKQIAEAHNGKISVDSIPGMFTVFKVVLPTSHLKV